MGGELTTTPILPRTAELMFVVFALASAALLSVPPASYPDLHTILDTGSCLLSAVLAWLFWDTGRWVRRPLFVWLGMTLTVTAALELLHVLVGVEWSGSLASITHQQDPLRLATWPPAAYILPLGISGAVSLCGSNHRRAPAFFLILTAMGAALLAGFIRLPHYTQPSVLGITRPTLLLPPFLWALVAWQAWRLRSTEPILRAVMLVSILFLLADAAMLYSRAPHDRWAMVAHLGKLCGYLMLLLALMRAASQGFLERMQAERRLAEETNTGRLAAIVESSEDAIISKTLGGIITSWNRAAEKLFGYSAAEVIGQPMLMILPPDKAAEEPQILAAIARGVTTRHFETVRLDRSGRRVDVSVTISPVRDSEGRIIGASTIGRDIGERKQAERKLREQLGRLDLLNQITRAIGERQDLASIYQVMVRSLEDNLAIDFGCVCQYDPLTGLLTVASVGARSRSLALELAMPERATIPIDQNGLSRCVQGDLVCEPDIADSRFPFPQRLARGGLRSLVVAPLSVESQVFGVLIAARHVAQSFSSGECEFLKQLSGHVALAAHQAQLYAALQRAYDDLRQTRQSVMQQERLLALGQMASGIAHDINNALSPVALYTESLMEREPGLSERGRSYLVTIRRAIEDVAETVSRMREFYRPREPQSLLASVDLNRLVLQVIELTRVRWSNEPQQRGIVIELRTELAPDLPPISGVEGEIRDALTNLLFNAVDAMPDGGTLTVRTRMFHAADSAAGGERVRLPCIEVADTGLGMDEETRRRCLEPFFTTKGERGTGLGLAMVYGMIQRHSGELDIESTPGQGTTVRLAFPAAADITSLADRSGVLLPQLRQLQILTVDDDPVVTESLRNALQCDGHQVTTADGGQAGIDTFAAALERGRPYDVVITDLGMPHIDGRKVAAAIRARSRGTPIILLTGWGQRLSLERDLPPDVDRLLSKPPRLRELRTALAELTGAAGAGMTPRSG